MNTSYTQVNIEQLRTLINSMSNAKSSCSSALNVFSNAMNSLISSGQIEGSALRAFETNMERIKSLQAAFEEYCTNVTKNLNNIITTEQSIEKEFNQEYNNLLSVNPEDYNG